MQFQQDCPKDKKITALLIFWRKTEKFRSTELYGAALEGSTNFLCRSSLGCRSMESCQLADLKYAIFSRPRGKTKNLPRSKLFLSMVFKHGLLDGLTSEQMWSIVFPRGFDWALWCGSRGINKFSLPQPFGLYVNGKLSISWFEICNFQLHKM